MSQALISDSLKSFGRVQRPGQEVHLSLPRSAAYPRKGERKRIYGVEKALAPSGYKPFKRRRNIEGRYGPYGYVHKRTTQNKSADVASQAAEYIFKRRALHERPPALNVNLSDDESDSGSEKEEE